MTDELTRMLIKHEGIKYKPYRDTVGKLTIGVGRNLDDKGISHAEAMMLLNNDIPECVALARSNFPWFDSLDGVRQDVVVEMIFNMGVGGLKTFHNMLAAIEKKDWQTAAFELFNSKWATQVGKERRDDMIRALEYGRWEERGSV